MILMSAIALVMVSCQSESNPQAQSLSNELLGMDTVTVSDTLNTEVKRKMEAAVVKDRVEARKRRACCYRQGKTCFPARFICSSIRGGRTQGNRQISLSGQIR